MAENEEKVCPKWPECGCSYQGEQCGMSMPVKEPERARMKLVKQVLGKVKSGEKFHEPAFKQMKRDMELAFDGHDSNWSDEWYTANIVNRHIQQRTAALYAKNPKATAKRRERMDFSIWDEDNKSLQRAMMGVQAANEIGDPTGGALAPMYIKAQSIVEDYSQGQERRKMLERIGKTLEILFSYFMDEQNPDFKTQAKALVRRVITTGCGFVKIGFQRQMERRPEVAARINDVTAQINRLQRLAGDVAKGDLNEGDAELEELRLMLESLMSEQMMIVREGLIFDFPEPDAVIVDPMASQLRGFVGAKWIAHKMYLSPDEVQEVYGYDVSKKAIRYDMKGVAEDRKMYSDVTEFDEHQDTRTNLVCVYEVYDKPSGLMYVVADGCPDFLTDPIAPPMKLETFWPVMCLTFNESEHKEKLYPVSDVGLIAPMQAEYNRARQGLREHRRANRPKYATAAGMLEDEDRAKLQMHPANAVLELQALAAGQKVTDVLQPVPMIGIDPNLYEVKTIFDDIQLVVGAQEATFGGVSKATATETSIAESARMSSMGANVDELDSFMTEIARLSGQILLQEMSIDQVKNIAGPGATWPEFSHQQIQEEIYLEIEAGSTGKPNRAAELANLERILPFLLQMPGIDPVWLVKEVLKRMDDKLDIDRAINDGMLSIAAQNSIQQAMAVGQEVTATPGNAPSQQGQRGTNQLPDPRQPEGSTAPMGANNV